MLALALHVASLVTFSHIVKWYGRRGCDLFAVAAVNYVFATVFSYGMSLSGPLPQFDAPIVLIGVIGGVSYALGFFIYFQSIHRIGISVSTTAMRLDVVPAVLASVLYWGEVLGPLQQVGVLLGLMALPLLTHHQGDQSSRIRGPSWLWIVALFMSSSLGRIVMKAFEEAGYQDARAALLVVWFGAAAITTTSIMVARRTAPTRSDIPVGLILGVLNVSANYFLLSALGQLPGALVFPIASAGGVLLAAITSVPLWRERLGRLTLSGMATSIASLVLINLHL